MVQKLILVALIIPLAALLGYIVANPADGFNLMIIGALLALLLFPFIIRWHHLLAIVSVNLFVNAFMLPGQPPLWVVMAFVSSTITYITWLIDRRQTIHWDHALAVPLVLLVLVVLGTAFATGGIAGQSMGGSQWGGKRYLTVLGAVAAFFAISMKPLSPYRARSVFLWFLLVGVSAIIGNLIILAGSGFYFLFNLFPYEFSTLVEDQAGTGLKRFTGFSVAAQFGILALVAAYGLRGIFTELKPARMVLFLILLMIGLFGGFRSFLIKLAVLFMIQFFLERMFQPRYIFAVLMLGVLLYAGVLGFASRLPLSVQRALTIVPFVELDVRAERDAWGTLDWRFQMWKIVIPDIPQYLLLGKGYSFSGTDVTLTRLGYERGIIHASYEETLITGNYHNGILTLLIPFGIWGLILFAWFLVVAFQRLYRNYRDGPQELRVLNTFILAWFCQITIHFFVFYGQFDQDLIKFTSLLALGLSINRWWTRSAAPQPAGLPAMPRSLSPAA